MARTYGSVQYLVGYESGATLMPRLRVKEPSSRLCEEGYAIYLHEGFGSARPNAKKAYVIEWPDAGILIPWPDGLTAKQAILAWARRQPQSWGYGRTPAGSRATGR